MSATRSRDEGSLRSIFFAVAAVPFLALSLVGLAVPAADRAELATATLLAQSIAIILAIVAIWTGDETTRRGRAGRRLGMVLVLAAVGLKLAGGAILG